jgi:hypothetical protein
MAGDVADINPRHILHQYQMLLAWLEKSGNQRLQNAKSEALCLILWLLLTTKDLDSDLSASIAQQRPQRKVSAVNIENALDKCAQKENRLAIYACLHLSCPDFLLKI